MVTCSCTILPRKALSPGNCRREKPLRWFVCCSSMSSFIWNAFNVSYTVDNQSQYLHILWKKFQRTNNNKKGKRGKKTGNKNDTLERDLLNSSGITSVICERFGGLDNHIWWVESSSSAICCVIKTVLKKIESRNSWKQGLFVVLFQIKIFEIQHG